MAFTPEEGKIGNHLTTMNVDKMNSDEIKKMMDLIDRKIELLENKTGYESTLTNLNSLSVNLEKADKKLADFFNSNPDLIIYRNNLSIEQINKRIDNANKARNLNDPFYNKTPIQESTNTITSNIADASAKISRGLNTFKLGLKIVVGTALSLTGIGLIAGIPLLKSASKQNKARRARQREERKISRELEEQTRDQKGSSATMGNLLAAQNLTTDQLYYILDHDDLHKQLTEDAYGGFDPSGKTKNFKFTKSQVINLRKQLERVKALQDPSKQTGENSKPITVAQDKLMDELYENTKTARKRVKNDASNKKEFETRLKFIISGNEDDLSKEDKAALEIYYMNDPAYESAKSMVESDKRNNASVIMEKRDTAEFKMYQAIMRTESGEEADSYKNGIEAKLRVLNRKQENNEDLFGKEIKRNQPYSDIADKVEEIKNFQQKIKDAASGKSIISTSYVKFINYDLNSLENSEFTHVKNCNEFLKVYNEFVSEFNNIKTTDSPEQYLRDLLDKQIDQDKKNYTSSIKTSTKPIDQARRKALNNCGKMDNVLDYYNETNNSTDPNIKRMRDDLLKFSGEYSSADDEAETNLKENDEYKKHVAELNSTRNKLREQTVHDFLKGYCSKNLDKVKEVVDKLKKSGMEPSKIQKLLNLREAAEESNSMV